MAKGICFLLLLVTAACAPMQDLIGKAPQDGRGFLANLAAEYADFAQNLQELGYEPVARLMEAKGRRAGRGETPAPQAASDATQEYYRRLMRVLEERPKRIVAQTAARAQVLYDCQTLEEPLPEEIIGGCREEFAAALEVLETVMESLVPRHRHTIYFTADSAALSADGYRGIGLITSQLLALERYSITVVGHAAPGDDPKQDWDIALQRAQRVSEALQEAGVPEARIRAISLGSSAPPIGVEENERLQRVDIKIHRN